jgi:subtilisin family serine protease
MRRTTRLAAMAIALALTLFTSRPFAQDDAVRGQAVGRAARITSNIYIVQLAELPVVAYRGGIAGLPATKAPNGQKVDPNNPQVVNYATYLNGRHDEVLGTAGGGRKLYDYRFSFNGFAAELTEAQANALRAVPGVVNVSRDEEQFADTSSSPTFLGLDAPGGLWDLLGGPDNAGEGVVIGVIDSGIWPESLSFSDRTGANGNASKDGKLDYLQLPGWHGRCAPGEQFTAADCNQKLIGAQHFNAGYGGNAGIEATRPWEFNSPRDYNGHGTHTSSTAGGNLATPTTGAASVFGPTNGIAPRARIAMYKALWSTEDGAQASGFNSDLVAAIDQAVADGVDVINYSISGTRTNFLDPAEVAFLFAADAGVFVAASAGNSGPTTGTVAHPSPWITTVAAGTHNRDGQGSVTLGNGATYNGGSVATAVGPAPLIDSTAAGLPEADPVKVALCYGASDNEGKAVLDPAKIAGKIVVCDRGVTARVAKSLAVRQAGGVGMILVNTSASTINADFHFVPTVHLSHTDRPAIKAYAATTAATAKINQATIVYNVAAPLTASFSSRGPLLAGNGDLLKPDVIAPGQDILASVAPPGNGGVSFNLYSGTSMSSPHVAGLAALLRDLHPDWSPMTIKSALMTSASNVLDGPDTNPLVIFRQGAGHARPNKAADPGLAYDSSFNDWLAMLCGSTSGIQQAFCNSLVAGGYSLDLSDFNAPSIAIGDLVSSQAVKRTVTNLGPAKATYTAGFTGLGGINAVVTPSTLTLNRGESKSFTVTVTRTTAALNAYTGGQLTWTESGPSPRIARTPVVVRPVTLVAPTEVSGTGGAINYDVRFGYSGTFAAAARGLIPAAKAEHTITDDPDDTFDPTKTEGTVAIPVTIAAGTTYARFSTFDTNIAPASDIDLYLYKGTTRVAESAGATSAEQINLLNPAAGTDYVLYIHGFAVPQPSAQLTLFTWLLGSASVGNMSVGAPANAVAGATATINLTFSGLAAGTKYLGSVAYSGPAGTFMPNPTIVRVDTAP